MEKYAEFPGHKDSIYSLCKPAEEGEFFSSGGDGLVVKWNIFHHDKPGKVIAQTGSPVYSMLYFEATNLLAAGARSGDLFLFDLNTNGIRMQAKLEGEIFALHLSGCTIYAGTGSGNLYSLNMNLEIEKQVNFSTKSCRAITHNPASGMLATAWSDNFIRLIEPASLNIVSAFVAHDNSVFSLGYAQGGKYLLSGGRDAHLKIWESENSTLFLDIPAHWFAINDIQFQESGRLFATASRDKTCKIWDADTFELLKVLDNTKLEGHTHSVNAVLWMKNGYLLSAGDDRKIEVWKIGGIG